VSVSGRADDEWLGELITRYGRLIRSVVIRVCGPDGAARIEDDVEQAVITAIWQQIKREQTIEFPASYVYRCAVRETVRLVRRDHDRQTEPLTEDIAVHHDPEQALADKQIADGVERCIATLDEDRQVAVRGHLAGLTVDEIMEINAWPYQKARNLIARGMADLRQLVRKQGIHDD
jgi:RNA polymerase sigma factor (sigma-70 family)